MMKNQERSHSFKTNVYFYKINLHGRYLCCVSARGVIDNGAGNRNVVDQADRVLGGNGLGIEVDFGKGKVSGITV